MGLPISQPREAPREAALVGGLYGGGILRHGFRKADTDHQRSRRPSLGRLHRGGDPRTRCKVRIDERV
jgi:hypothetical protein